MGIHELGHFLAAVTRGIHVTKFSIGFGPTLFKWQVRVCGPISIGWRQLLAEAAGSGGGGGGAVLDCGLGCREA